MSYDIELTDPVTKEVLHVPGGGVHHMTGGTYAVGGTTELTLNVTYNYSKILYDVIPGGIRSLYGRTAAETIPTLKNAAESLGNDCDADYWKPTEGNVKRAILQLLSMATMRPDGVWQGD